MQQRHQQKELSGWGNYPKSEGRVFTPFNQKDLVSCFPDQKVIARGYGRSYGDLAINKGKYVMDLSKIHCFLTWDESRGVLKSTAGISLAEIIAVFVPRGWFPMITPGTKFVSLGGCIANDIHGKAHHRDGSFANSVEEFQLLLADKRILNASRNENEDLFWANFGGLGLLGIILTVSIKLKKIETSYFQQKTIPVKNLDELLDTLDQYDEKYQYSVSWIDSLAKGKKLGRGVVILGNLCNLKNLPSKYGKIPLKTSSKREIQLPFYLPNFALNRFSIYIFNRLLNHFQSTANPIVHYDSFLFPLDGIKNWNRGYGKRGFIQYQFVIPLRNGVKNIHYLLEKIAGSGYLPFLNVLKKFGKGVGGLSFPMKGYTFSIDFPFSKDLPNFTKELDQMVLEAGGRIYLGKDALLDHKMFQLMYPQYKSWIKLKEKYDPDDLFSSDASRRLGLNRL